jgi:hypothetical protein
MFYSLTILNKAFEFINQEEKKINYEYEPHCKKEDDSWKRHLFFFELKKDFIKDVTEFGFCPYIQKLCQEQRKDKTIMKFKKADNFARTDYIKNLYKKIPVNSNNNRLRNISPKTKKNFRFTKNKSMKVISYTNNKTNSRNNFLSNIYGKISKRQKELNGLKLSKKNFSKSIDNIANKKSINKYEEGAMDIESFIYEPERSHLKYKTPYRPFKEKIERYNSKDNSLYDNNKNDIINNNKSFLYNFNNVEPKKSGWKMTTSLESAKLYKKMKTGFIFNKSIVNSNNSNNNNATSFEAKKNINNKKHNENSFRNSIYALNIRNSSEHNKKNEVYYSNLMKKDKQNNNDRNYKLFNHLRRMNNEIY